MKNIVASAMLLTALNVTPSFAAHPLEGDDTATHGPGNYQLELNSEADLDRQRQDGSDIRSSTQQLATIFSAGLGKQVDLVLGLPWQWTSEKQDGVVNKESGAGDLSVELKWRFFERDGFSLAVKPGMTLPTGREGRGLGNGRIAWGGTVIATKEMAPVTMHLNVAYYRNEYGMEADRQANRNDIVRTTLSGGVEVVENLQLVAEVGAATNVDRSVNTWPVFATIGAIYSLRDNIDLDLGVKYGLTESAPDAGLLAGFSMHF